MHAAMAPAVGEYRRHGGKRAAKGSVHISKSRLAKPVAANRSHNPPFMAPHRHTGVIKITLCNVVCGGSVGAEMPLDVISGFKGAIYNPQSFPGVRFRLGDCTVLLFGTGKVVVVGAVSRESAFRAMDLLVGMLADHGIRTGTATREIRNVVATADLGLSLDLNSVARVVRRSLYEPEHFPGVIMRRQDPKCTILLFATGKMVCVGAGSAEAASSAANRLHAELGAAGLT